MMEIVIWSLVGIIAFILFLTLILTITKWAKSKKQKSGEKTAEQVVVHDGVRLTPGDSIENSDGTTKVSLNKGDIVIGVQKTMVAKIGGELSPGKYTILATKENEPKFNVKIGAFVKEYSHGETVVLAEGDEVTPTSQAIILR